MQVAAKKSKLPHIITALPGPKARQIVERDHKLVSPSYTRDYPLVAKAGAARSFATLTGTNFSISRQESRWWQPGIAIRKW